MGVSEGDLAGWRQLVYCRKPEGNLLFSARWIPSVGITLCVRERATGRLVAFTLNTDGFRAEDLTAENGDGAELTGTRFIPFRLLNEPRSSVPCTLKFRENDWSLYIDDRLCASLAAPFEPPADVFERQGRDQAVEEPVRFRPVPTEQFRSDFMIEEGAPNQLYPWKIESGQWRIHTAMEDALARPESNVDRIKQVPLTPDKSPNFYSLKGGGKNAVITTGYDFFDDYVYAAAMQANMGEVGLVFYHRDQENYYGYTIAMDKTPEHRHLRLWRVRNGAREVLARARVPLHLNQWHLPKVAVHTDEIVCYLDGVEVIRAIDSLPPGGKIGLYAHTDEEVRFDDVYLEAFERIPTATVGNIRYQTLYQDGAFYRNRSFWRRGTPADETDLKPPVDSARQFLVLGRPHNRNAVFSADFDTGASVYEIGLVAGFRSPDKPYYLLSLVRTPMSETARVARVRRGHEHVLESWTLDRHAGDPETRPVSLMVDASEEGVLRFLKNDKLLSILWVDEPVEGGAGPMIGPDTDVVVRNLAYGFHRDTIHEKQQENPVFQQDSFMRHWASPEGQWIAGEGGLLWHKGDFFGDFMIRLPCIADSELHVGVRDGEQDGPVSLSVTHDRLNLMVSAAAGSEPNTYEVPLTAPEKKTVADMDYEFHHEGHWIWVVVDGKTVLKHRLGTPFVGTRCRIKGLTLPQLARSRVTRTNVIDDYFNESPHDWIVNGGDWQIVNRFQCTPSWSHMIGQSDTGMAALWYKKRFHGNFTLEFYAGTRHGWYERAGDLNCTIMAHTTSPGSGYTVTCTEWDQNLSQNWTTLYRNGKVADRSEEYLVPRRRKGMVRKFLNPLVSEGRPIHGAWYYIKVRKIGQKLEYYFDNQKIFELNDPEVIHSGLVGIWTFMHSMTLAQVKLTFQHAEPLQFPVETLRPYEPAPPDNRDDPPPEPTPHWDIAANGFPLDSLDPVYWSHTDDVAQSRMMPFRMNAGGLRVVNRMGAGRMFITPDLAPLPLDTVAGWRFLMKRSPGAMVNAHYSVGTVDGNGTYSPTQSYFHHISGEDFSEGAYTLTGASTVPAADSVDSPAGEWHPVTVWIPSRYRTPTDAKRNIMVRFEGFGLRQESTAMCGIPGNAPGDAYAIRQLAPIFYGTPALTKSETPSVRRFAIRDERCGELVCEVDSLEQAQTALNEMTRPGMNAAWIKVYDDAGRDLFHDLLWIELPETLDTNLAWHPEQPDALLLEAATDYVDRRFAAAKVQLDGTLLPMEPGNREERVVRLPREKAPAVDQPLAFTVNSGTEETTVTLDWAQRRVNAVPVLVTLDGLGSSIITYETGVGHTQFEHDGRMSVEHADPAQGKFLQIRNRALEQRLAVDFTSPFSVAEYPLMMFRYRAFDMTHLTVAFKNYHYVRLNDDYGSAAQVRLAHDLKLDESWHSWLGFVSDAFTREPFSVSRFTPPSYRIASAGSPDQTGRYSKWHLDDLVFGPAVAKPEQLAFTPVYYDLDGVATVYTCVSEGDTCFADMDASTVATLVWEEHKPGSPVVPDLAGFEDGVHHLFFKAVDTAAAESSVTDLPFLLDRKPLTVAHDFGVMADPASNGRQLTVTFDNHGAAPWAIEKATFSVAGKQQALPAWTSLFRHGAGADRLILNYPFIFRKELDDAKDGDTLEFAIDTIVDGAGNATPKVTIPFTVDYSKDQTGPAWYAFSFGTSVDFFWNWDGYRSSIPAFSPGQHNTATISHKTGTSPFIANDSYRDAADLSRGVSWQPAKHPWLSCRINLPEYNARRNVAMHLILTTTDNKNYSISLTDPGKSGTELNRTRTINWEKGEWQRLSFNVRDMLKNAGVGDEELAKLTVSQVNIQRRGTKHREGLYLDDFFLHGPPADPSQADTMKWYAYDASGVASLEVTCVDDAGKDLWRHTFHNSQADLNALRPKIQGSAWLRCQAKDKAGNLSVPFWLPLAS